MSIGFLCNLCYVSPSLSLLPGALHKWIWSNLNIAEVDIFQSLSNYHLLRTSRKVVVFNLPHLIKDLQIFQKVIKQCSLALCRSTDIINLSLCVWAVGKETAHHRSGWQGSYTAFHFPHQLRGKRGFLRCQPAFNQGCFFHLCAPPSH